jgi:hypothetical protein
MPNVTLSPAQIAGYAQAAGFSGANLITAIAIALAESSGNTWAIDNDSNGSQDQGLWQINTIHAGSYPGMTTDPGSGHMATAGTSVMFNPATNATAAFQISSSGSSFTPWSTFNNGAYSAFVGAATTAAGDPTVPSGSGSGSTPAASNTSAPATPELVQGELIASDPTRALTRIFSGHIVGQPAMGYLPLNATVVAAIGTTQCTVTVDGFDSNNTATFTCNFQTQTSTPSAGTACIICFPGNDPQGYGWVLGFKT